jgi:hypothetical protein
MARLDSRPNNRDLAGKVAHRLPDLRIYERMHRSFVEVAPGAALSSQASFAVYAGDKALLEQTAALSQLRPCDRIHIAATRVDLGLLAPQAGMREMEAAALGDQEGSGGLQCLIGVLENVVAANKIESWRLPPGGRWEHTRNVTRALSSEPNGAIVGLARKWLGDHPDPRGLDGAAVRGSLARALRRMGKPAEALLAIEPAVSTGQGAAMRETAIAHALLKHADAARSLMQKSSARYPGASSVVGQAAIEWRLGNPVDAAKIVKQSGQSGEDFNRALGEAMADAFLGDKTPGLETAVNELFKTGIREDAKQAILDALVVGDVKRAIAVIDQLAEPVQHQYAIVRHYNAIRSVKGETAAQALGRRLLRSAPPSLAQLVIAGHGQEAPLWFLSEPPAPQARDLLWLFRAVAAQWNPRSVYVDALRRHFAKPSPDKGLGSDRSGRHISARDHAEHVVRGRLLPRSPGPGPGQARRSARLVPRRRGDLPASRGRVPLRPLAARDLVKGGKEPGSDCKGDDAVGGTNDVAAGEPGHGRAEPGAGNQRNRLASRLARGLNPTGGKGIQPFR